MSIYEIANKIARAAFADKFDLAGDSYYKHLLRVKDAVEENWKHAGDDVFAAAILHDLLEDCPQWNADALRNATNNTVVETVEILTKRKDEPYGAYIMRIVDSGSYAAKLIKIADLKDNLDVKRLVRKGEFTEKDRARIDKYLKALKELTD